MSRLGWLHLSDLHLGEGGSYLLLPEFREAFEEDLRRVHERTGPWHVVFISGALTMSGKPRQFDLVSSTLGSLWELFRSLGSNPCLLAVPGIHDFWRSAWRGQKVDPNITTWAADARRALRASSSSPEAWLVRGGFFRLWFAEWRQRHPSTLVADFNHGLLPGDFSATVVANGLKLGVLGLNSTFRTPQKEGSDDTFEIHVEQLEVATGQQASAWAQKHDVLMLLTHQPPSRLASAPAAALARKLEPTGRLLHLCGDQSSVTARTTHGSLPELYPLQAPLLFSRKVWPEVERWGYTAGQFDFSDDVGWIKLLPRAASSQKGAIVLGPGRGLDSSGAIVIPLRGASAEQKAAMAAGAPEDVTPSRKSTISLHQLRALDDLAPPASLPPGVRLQAVLDTGGNTVERLAWAPMGDALGIGLYEGHLAYWVPGERAPRWVIRAHNWTFEDLCFSPDSQALASLAHQEVRVWSKEGTRVSTPKPLRGRYAVTWSSGGLLATEGEEGGLRVWNAQGWADTRGDVRLRSMYALAWSPDGKVLGCGGQGVTLFRHAREEASSHSSAFSGGGKHLATNGRVVGLAWHPASRWIAAACLDKTVYIFDPEGKLLVRLEGYTDAVMNVACFFDGRLLATRSIDGAIRLWRTDHWKEVARIEGPSFLISSASMAFAPTKPVLATIGNSGTEVRLWQLDIDALLRASNASSTVHEVSAKVVLVGEGRAGKSCLARRMVEDQYEELESTHGMRFWSLPVASAGSAGESGEVRREIALWDLGGQSEYQLVHQLFLRDSTVALMVMEPGRGERALEEIEGWDRRLRAQTGERRIRKILVGTKVDGLGSPVNRAALEELVRRLEFDAYVLTSARQGEGIPELKAMLERAIDWSAIEKVSRPELFQRIRGRIQQLREAKRVVLSFFELERELRRELGKDFDPGALQAVLGHLTRQGRVADTRMAGGTRVLILEVEQIERYASSLIIAARENPQGIPALEVAKLLSPRMKFPRIPDEERLPEDQELPVLNCVIELLIEHGVCLRHEGLLIFPSLFQPTRSESNEAFSHSISLHYDFFGPIDNIYASLVTALAVSQRFGPLRLWENRAEFGHAGRNSSGVRRIRSVSQGVRGIAQLDIYFDEGTDPQTRELFVNFVEQHLREQGVELLERLAVTCSCGWVFPEELILRRLSEGTTDIGCPSCDRRTQLTPGAQQARERNPALVQEIQALRTTIREQRIQTAVEVKAAMSGTLNVKPASDRRVRILHLSDLHIRAEDDPLSLLQPLAADLRDKEDGLGLEHLDYLVISGDITQRASPQEFEKARAFVSGLIEEFGLTAQRCVIVPGNHDLDWETSVYTWKKKRHVDVSRLAPGSFRPEGDGYNLRDEQQYLLRFKNFSEHFFHPLTQKPYPLASEEQCLSYLFAEERLQFLAMNSAWEIDEYFQERSSISEQALARGLAEADQDLTRARAEGQLAKDTEVLRIAVWHHPVTGNEKIRDDAFMERLMKSSVRLCLHGHVHEDRADLVNSLDPKRQIHVVGAGSFGAPVYERPESVPRLYNLLELHSDSRQLRVHTRSRRKQGGAWGDWAVWPGPERGVKRSFYDVKWP